MSIESLINLMADGEFHSGGALGEKLGIGRGGVWKRIQKLEALGVDCHSVRGKGYRIPGGIELLEKDRIFTALDPIVRAQISELNIQTSVSSTNDIVMKKAESGEVSGYVCLAEQQSAGRGRRGRQWVSPFGKNIYLSILWQFSGGAASLEGLSLAAGVAVADALRRYGINTVSLKWPNDLLIEDRKLAGVLLEMSGDAAGPCQIVLGVGLNLSMPSQAAEEIDQPWTDLDTIYHGVIERNRIASLLIDELLGMLSCFEKQGFEPFRRRWLAINAFHGHSVELHMTPNIITGIERGVDNTGALLLETAKGLESFKGGELSLRKKR